LNGMTKTGHKAKYASKFKNLRYAIILLASLVLPIFEDNTKKIQNSTFINYYNGRRGKRTVFDCRRRWKILGTKDIDCVLDNVDAYKTSLKDDSVSLNPASQPPQRQNAF
jgi:hypothetical protein